MIVVRIAKALASKFILWNIFVIGEVRSIEYLFVTQTNHAPPSYRNDFMATTNRGLFCPLICILPLRAATKLYRKNYHFTIFASPWEDPWQGGMELTPVQACHIEHLGWGVGRTVRLVLVNWNTWSIFLQLSKVLQLKISKTSPCVQSFQMFHIFIENIGWILSAVTWRSSSTCQSMIQKPPSKLSLMRVTTGWVISSLLRTGAGYA